MGCGNRPHPFRSCPYPSVKAITEATHPNLAGRNKMKHFTVTAGIAIISACVFPVGAEPLFKDIAARIEAIPIQTLTRSDEQFLKGDAYGKPTTIAGVLRIAQGSGHLPLVILAAGSSGFG